MTVTFAKRDMTMRILMVFVAVAGLWIGGSPVHSQAEAWRERGTALGLRVAMSGPNKNESYHMYELLARLPLPWRWDWPQGWDLSSHIETSIGALRAAGKTGFMVAAMPGITMRRRHWRRLSLLANVGVAWASEHRFGEQPVGGPVQFILSPGLDYKLWTRWHLSYRYRHLSNATLYRPNPGVELHFLGLSYPF